MRVTGEHDGSDAVRRACVLAIVVAGCGRVGFDPIVGAGGDAGSDGGADAQTCTTFGPWDAPVRIDELASPMPDFSPNITPDGLVIYFQSRRTSLLDDLYVATRATPTAAFDPPVLLTLLSSPSSDRDPAITASGLYFTSDRPTSNTVDQVFLSTGAGTQFAAPSIVSELGIGVFGPWVSNDELDIYYEVAAQLYHSSRTVRTDPWGTGAVLAELGSAGYATLSVDQLTIFFERPGLGVMTATRTDRAAAFSPPILLPVANMGFMGTGDPELSADGLTLYFDGDLTGGGDFDIYKTTRPCLD